MQNPLPLWDTPQVPEVLTGLQAEWMKKYGRMCEDGWHSAWPTCPNHCFYTLPTTLHLLFVIFIFHISCWNLTSNLIQRENWCPPKNASELPGSIPSVPSFSIPAETILVMYPSSYTLQEMWYNQLPPAECKGGGVSQGKCLKFLQLYLLRCIIFGRNELGMSMMGRSRDNMDSWFLILLFYDPLLLLLVVFFWHMHLCYKDFSTVPLSWNRLDAWMPGCLSKWDEILELFNGIFKRLPTKVCFKAFIMIHVLHVGQSMTPQLHWESQNFQILPNVSKCGTHMATSLEFKKKHKHTYEYT